MSVDTVRVSQRGKEQLVTLKRRTGIRTWNVLCRWALATSLADPSVPLVREVVTDSNVEMSWRTFGGVWADVYLAHVTLRAWEELGEVSDAAVEQTLVAHLHRGIGYLAAHPKLVDVAGLVEMS